MARMKDHLYDITEGTIDEIYTEEKVEETYKEIENLINELEETVELPTGETVKIDKIELKELQELPFGAIY